MRGVRAARNRPLHRRSALRVFTCPGVTRVGIDTHNRHSAAVANCAIKEVSVFLNGRIAVFDLQYSPRCLPKRCEADHLFAFLIAPGRNCLAF
jgi:hypothetical protein